MVGPPRPNAGHQLAARRQRPTVIPQQAVGGQLLRRFVVALTRCNQLIDPARTAIDGIDQTSHRASQCPQFDRVKMPFANGPAERIGRASSRCHGLLDRVRQRGQRSLPEDERQPQLLRCGPVARGEEHEFRVDPCRLAKRRQPVRPMLFVVRKLQQVEDDENDLVFPRGFPKELLHRCVVVLLHRQHGDEQVGTVADRIGPSPVDLRIAVDIGGIEQQQVLGQTR